ncbi:MAG: SCP2 sterol-binding domain-containing protein [Kangiellaceae bacterium]|nr:SCP2 sterol-binding domain-containing protein [Kangiellaceae bacterium]
MPLNQLSATALQSIARQILALDIEASKTLRPFDGKIILIEVTDLKLQYYFVFEKGQMSIYSKLPTLTSNDKTKNNKEPDQIPSVTITGKFSSFITAAASEYSSDALFEGDLHFNGEINTAKQFQQLAASLNIDWQEPLAKILGDPLAHTINTGVQKFASWFIQSANSARHDVSEYLQEEARITPSDSEQQHFFEQVDQLKSKTDRLTARVELLIKKKTAENGK